MHRFRVVHSKAGGNDIRLGVVALVMMASVKMWRGFWQLVAASLTSSAPLPPHKLSHLVENCSSLAKRKVDRGKGGWRGKGRGGGWAEASSQSLELWLWEKTVTLSSHNSLDRGGILSLGPLGLEKAIEGYFLRREAKIEWVWGGWRKNKERGERGSGDGG